eukprot:365272-Chlamydomonas_euryale.AAC.9
MAAARHSAAQRHASTSGGNARALAPHWRNCSAGAAPRQLTGVGACVAAVHGHASSVSGASGGSGATYCSAMCSCSAMGSCHGGRTASSAMGSCRGGRTASSAMGSCRGGRTASSAMGSCSGGRTASSAMGSCSGGRIASSAMGSCSAAPWAAAAVGVSPAAPPRAPAAAAAATPMPVLLRRVQPCTLGGCPDTRSCARRARRRCHCGGRAGVLASWRASRCQRHSWRSATL